MSFNTKIPETATTSKRILTPEQAAARREAAIQGGIQGTLLGFSLGAAGVLLAHRFHPGFRALAPSIKAMVVGSSTLAGAIGQAENASLALERTQFGYADESHMNIPLSPRIGVRSTKDETIQWLNDRRWTIIGVTWAVGMTGSLAYSFSNRYLNWQQKLVQARMYAQAITIGALMITAAISIAAGEEGNKKHDTEDARLRQIIGLPATSNNTHH